MREQITFRGFVASVDECMLTHHAVLRMSQRNVSRSDIDFVLRHGQVVHRAGAILVFLRDKDVPKNQRANKQYQRLQGMVVVLSRELPEILTVYRNRAQGFKHIRRKADYSCPPRWLH